MMEGNKQLQDPLIISHLVTANPTDVGQTLTMG